VELLVQQVGLSLRGLEHVGRSSALGARGHADARAGAGLLGPGFAHVVDPDMLHLGDDVTVQALFQAHTFEDRVLKVDHVHVRDGATVGAALGGDEARTARAGRGVRGRADAGVLPRRGRYGRPHPEKSPLSSTTHWDPNCAP
jgi:hypothetical protein